MATLDEIIDEQLARVWMDGVHPNDVRDDLKRALTPYLRPTTKQKRKQQERGRGHLSN